MLIMITKAHMYDSSNSTLYYEQAEKQLKALSENNVYDIPIRLVGLASHYSDDVECTITKYDKPRYSRKIENQTVKIASITQGTSVKSRAVITVK
jgi:beta-lactamase class D